MLLEAANRNSPRSGCTGIEPTPCALPLTLRERLVAIGAIAADA